LKPKSSTASQEIHAFYVTRSFTAVLKTTRHLSLSWVRYNHLWH